MELMHLRDHQIRDMLAMGHSIGVHSHSHLSVAASQLSQEDVQREIVYPREFLEEKFDTPVHVFSYPFGGIQDCLKTEELLLQTQDYRLAFTVEKHINKKDTSPLELGRYMPRSTDDDDRLKTVLDQILAKDT